MVTLFGFKALQETYQTLLMMYGEKLEETQELRLDLVDMKEMYKSQIQCLLENASGQSSKEPLTQKMEE